MLRKGAASADMITVNNPRRWGGFTDSTEALQTKSTACLSVQFYKGKKPSARMKLQCHTVPPMVLQHDLLLGRDSFLRFQNHTYATLPKEAGRPVVGILNLRQKPMVVREGKQNIPFSSHECSEIPAGLLIGTSNGPMMSTTLNNTGFQEHIQKSRVANVTERSQLDKDRGQESDRKEEPPDTLGAHLLAPQREPLKKVWQKLPQHKREIKFKLGDRGWTPKISIPSSAFNVFIKTGFARQRLGVGGLRTAPDYS